MDYKSIVLSAMLMASSASYAQNNPDGKEKQIVYDTINKKFNN